MRAHLFLFAALLCLSACPATQHAVNGENGTNVPAMTPQAIMIDKPCGGLPTLRTPNVNPHAWSSKPPSGMQKQECGGSGWGPYYCATGSACNALEFGVKAIA